MTALPWLSLASFAPRKGGEEEEEKKEEERGEGAGEEGREKEQ